MSKQPLNVMENLAIIPDPTILDKGFYVPSLTKDEILAFTPSNDGIIVFDKDNQIFMTFLNGTWTQLISPSSVTIPSNTIDPINPVMGEIYYNTVSDRLRIFTTRWATIPRVFD